MRRKDFKIYIPDIFWVFFLSMCDLQKKSGNKSGKGQEKTREESREKIGKSGKKMSTQKKSREKTERGQNFST